MAIGQILIGKNAAYLAKRGGGSIASAKEVNDLAEGAFAIIGDEGTLITTAADFVGVKHFYIAVGGATAAKTTMSKKVNRSFEYQSQAYVAPVSKVLYIGDDNTDTYDTNLPATLVAGTYATLTLIDTANDTIPHKKIERYDYRVKTGDAKEDVLQALIDQVNTNSELAAATAIGIATANAGIKFDAVSGVDLKVVASNILIDAPVTGVTAPKPGSGSPTLVAELESYYSVYQGNTARLNLNGLMYSEASRVDTSATYHLYTLNYEYNKQTVLNTVQGTKQILQLAIVTGAASIATLATLLSAAQTSDADITANVTLDDHEDRITVLEP